MVGAALQDFYGNYSFRFRFGDSPWYVNLYICAMVTFQKTIKKRADTLKALGGLKKQNVKIKSEKLSKKKRGHGDFVNVETPKVNDEMGKLRNMKVIKKKPKKEVQGSISLGEKSTHSEFGKNRINKLKNIQHTETEAHVDSDKSEHKMNGVEATNYTVKAEPFTNSKEHDNKIAAETTKIVKAQKRKRADSISDCQNVDCLNLNDLSKEHILQCISAIYHLTEKQLESKNALFDGESQPVFMQVTCIRIPKTPRRCMRVLLPHSIVSSDDEVALFVGDLVRGRRKDYEPTVEYYENLLRKHGCTRIKSIIPMNQVKTEYDQFELKRKLVGSYDWFLVDGKIAGHLSHLLGKEFYKKRKLPTPVRLQTKGLNHEIEYALKKTLMQIHSYGDTHVIQIGHSSMEKEKVFENIVAACTYLSKNYPGGWANIRSIKIKTSTSLALSIYTTLKSKNMVQVPVVKPKRPKAYCDVTGELTTVPNIAAVTVTPEGDVTVIKTETADE